MAHPEAAEDSGGGVMSGWSVGNERKGISGSPSIPASALKGKDISRLTAAEVELLTQQGKRAQKAGFQAKARKPAPGRAYHTEGILNETEYRYAMLLDERLTSGEILAWEFEKIRLVLAPRTTYTPDFMVFKSDGTIEFHEVKGGHWEDDARVKIKTCAEHFPYFTFVAVQLAQGGGWKVEVFGKESSERKRRI